MDIEIASKETWFFVPPTTDELRAFELARSAAADGVRVFLVARSEGVTVARLSARLIGDALRIYPPKFTADVPTEQRASLVDQLLVGVEAVCAQQFPSIRRLETKPADDVIDLENWLADLKRNSFRQIACSRIYVCTFDSFWPALPCENVVIASGEHAQVRHMVMVHQEAMKQTFDRLDARHPPSSREHILELVGLAEDGGHPPVVAIARFGGRPVGMVIGGQDIDGGDGDSSHWILDVAVIPQVRGVRIGTSLVGFAATTLMARGPRPVKALIDDENIPSIKLHNRLGFRPIPARYMTYEKPPSR